MIFLPKAAGEIKPIPGSISPSQIVTAQKCLRKWAFRQLARIKAPEGPAQKFGGEVHTHAENWLTFGTPPPQTTKAGRLTAEGIPHLPRPGIATCELGFNFVFAGVPWLGYLDAYWTDQDGAHVLDHKTTARPDLAIKAETAGEDPQHILYSLAALVLTPGASIVLRRWLIYPTDGKRNVYPVDTSSDVRTVVTGAERLAELGRKLYQIRLTIGQTSAQWVDDSIPCDPKSCDLTGVNCDYSELCNMKGDR